MTSLMGSCTSRLFTVVNYFEPCSSTMSGWSLSELFRRKSQIYTLDEVSKEWVDRGISGLLIMFQNDQFLGV